MGVALIYLAGYGLGGHAAALASSSGAVYASLADVPNPPARTWRRVCTAAIVGIAVSLLVASLRDQPLAIGAAIALVGFLSALALAWGVRAGPISFVGVMTFVFTMAAPAAQTPAALFAFVGWIALGAGLYLAWAVLAAIALAPRYRTLALADVLDVTAQLLRSRADWLATALQLSPDRSPVRAWIALDSVLDEKLQTARDMLFAARETGSAQQQTAILLLAIDLRDTLLLSQLDLDLLGNDDPGKAVRRALVANYAGIADALNQLHESIRRQAPLPAPDDHSGPLRQLSQARLFDPADRRGRLLPALLDRSRHMAQDLSRIQAIVRGVAAERVLAREQLQMFVSVEGWPLAALRPHLNLASPVLRHALRSAAALTAAYFIALALPWSSHPHWLVLSVAVVLRGSLEQTLLRRNLRLAGTVFGCLIVLALSHLATGWLSTAVFLSATGLAHAFSVARYFVTATAATVMALLQDHLANPQGGFAIAERLADTAMGALLAWAFSYVLPSWERGSLPRLSMRLVRALDALSTQVLKMPQSGDGDVGVRLARREVYEALRAIAAAGQRSRVEPKAVRVPAQLFADLLAHSHALMAHFASVRVLLVRRGEELDPGTAQRALSEANVKIRSLLSQPPEAPGAESAPSVAPEADLPSQSSALALTTWLQRRLQMACAEAARTMQAAAALNSAARTSI